MEAVERKHFNESLRNSKSLKQRVLSNYGWSVVSEFGGKGIFFFITVYLARKLGVEKFGLLTFAQTLAIFFWLGVDLGINMYGAREITKKRESPANIINPLLTLRILSGLFMFSLFILVTIGLSAHSTQRLVFIGAALYLVARSINTDWIFRGLERFNYIAGGNFITFLSMAAAVLLFVKDSNDVVIASFLWSLCYLWGGFFLLLVLLGKIGIRFKPVFKVKTWLLHLRESVHFTISGGLSTLYQFLPIILLKLLVTEHELGLFSASFRLIFAITYVLSIAPLALYPIFSDFFFTNREKFYRLHSYYKVVSILAGLLIGASGTLFGERIIYLIYGQKYIDSAGMFNILIWFVALVALRQVYGIAIASSGLQRFYTYVSLFGLVSLTTILFTLSHVFNISYSISACVSLVVTEFCVLLMLIFIWRNKIEMAR